MTEQHGTGTPSEAAETNADGGALRMADPDVGRRLGPWRLLRELGRGGQGAVYLAEDERLHRKAAVKLLTATDLTGDALDRFKREAAVASRLDHPGICAVYDVGLEGRTPYIAMRYVEGESLAQRIRATKARTAVDAGTVTYAELLDSNATEVNRAPPSPPTPSARSARSASPAARPASRAPADPRTAVTQLELMKVVRLLEQAARAVHAAHEAGVIHRDLKPGNIMVTTEGEPVVLDFGLAKDMSGVEATLTQEGDVMGTPAYMSPEQVAGHAVALDRRTDVYSLGVTLFECLTLQRPFDAPTRVGLYQAILTRPTPDPRTLNRALPFDLKVILETALEKDRARRYATALDFAEDLRRVRCFEPIAAKPAGPLTKLYRWTQRNPALAAALIGLIVVLAAGLAIAVYLLDQKDHALADYDRLGDVSRLTRMSAEAERFWPAEPAKKPAMERWLEEAASLEKNLPGHRAVRDGLRASSAALPYTDADRAADAAQLRPLAERREAATTQRDKLAAALTAAASQAASRAETSAPAAQAASQPTAAGLRAMITKLNAELATLDARLQERLTWRFTTEAAQFKHDTIGKLAAELETFLDPDPFVGAVASVKKRLAYAVAAEEALAKTHAARWEAAIASIADPKQCPEYGGLQFAPQYGLVPIRRDPQSGLWEFAHLQTTADGADPLPAVRPDGRYDLQETTGLIFVLIPGGTFQMGARRPTAEEAEDAAEGEPLPPNVDPGAQPKESPVHPVTLAPYFLSKYEMTQGQWLRSVGRNPSSYVPGGRFGDKSMTLLHPVEQISWEDCVGERGWIGRLGLALPAEAQWEYACRAKTTTPWWTGAEKETLATGGNVADAYGKANGGPPNWSYETWNDGYTVHAPIGRYAPNGFGLHDTIGNVVEWCRDGHTGYAADNWRQGDGLRNAGSSPRDRVLRGGGFLDVASSARSASRNRGTLDIRLNNLGVRPSRRVTAP